MRNTPAVLLLTIICLTGCQEKQVPLKTAEQLYDYYCKQCHQQKGAGAYLENIPPQQRTMQSYQVILMIRYHEPGSHPMASFTQLDDQQADLLAEYVVKLGR
ncbi:c-type cytochrome [Neptunomonas phycophila]|jgi:mono/diheme cytochrome c family protein|uniref:C-type cytochrome n=1 Tax=Neptunomonas phycophila TaxID=1572645 RepID=A0ABT9EWX1_9GAMM|nr:MULTISPECIES: c-type cytochrome [Neptunomonas]MBT3144707.1 cytochrome c [Neptunomonas phycophila]MDN2660847.1 c-type cytochrome [Neptunomonas sp. CHC150]MDO6467902.1 c-type cytochrome [Neptunomonas phycophila]MDO6783946.1 c-type cytochrome [Neptunomonas phycophila]MDP2523435.1 c-type cytochrome [Neptunomonas phycophila]